MGNDNVLLKKSLVTNEIKMNWDMFNQIWKEALGEGESRTLTWKKNFFWKITFLFLNVIIHTKKINLQLQLFEGTY